LEAIMPEQLVTVGRYGTPFEANLVKGELEAFEVDAVLADDNAVGINWLWSNMLGGVKVRVPESELDEARLVLSLESGEAPEFVESAGICPACGSTNSHAFVDKRGSFLTWLLIGVPVIPALQRRICDDCGAKFKA
jgi:hypothetical protein